jgi:hypothetical protein
VKKNIETAGGEEEEENKNWTENAELQLVFRE